MRAAAVLFLPTLAALTLFSLFTNGGGGPGALPLLAAALAAVLALLVRLRQAMRGLLQALVGALGRSDAVDVANPGASVRDAVSAYGLHTPRAPEPRQELLRPEPVLAEAPPAKSVAATELESKVAGRARPDPPASHSEPAREKAVGATPRVPRPAMRSRVVACEVAFWRGYVKAQLYARILGDEGLAAIATSPMFRCRSATPEQTDECIAALVALRGRLAAEGWKPDGRGEAWYARRFRNPAA